MSSLSEQSQDRKARLLALRNKRKQPSTEPLAAEPDQVELSSTSTLTTANSQTIDETTTANSEEPPLKKPVLKSRNFNFDTNTQNKAIDHLSSFTSAAPSTINKHPQQQQPLATDNTQDSEQTNDPPKFIISSSETLEAVSLSLQSEILAQIQTKYHPIQATSGKKDSKKKITDDLVRDIQDDLELLDERYELCLKQLMRERIRGLQLKEQEQE
ncbi:hypothetical protein WICPIJ_004090 [Wickerhamomyces pijperi]|uniref:Uncharacterized protein n=1 Tax=Wickerhamomyces pijperi TaxID=599730 RepID=A0A9P8TN87_WICPI|nr:hypothetical protein WICPIJ_004090 [Wickerhamomyces pijperi]